jgi:cell division septum initiation protein DivIVA
VQHVQVNLLTADLVRLGEAIRYLTDKVSPLLEELPGSQGMSVSANTELGVAVVESFWVSHHAMREHEKTVAPAREEAARLSGGTVSVERFVVASFTRSTQWEDAATLAASRSAAAAIRADVVAATESSIRAVEEHRLVSNTAEAA